MFGTASGAVAGLVAITPAAGYVSVIPAIIIGTPGKRDLFYRGKRDQPKLGYDDSLDAFGVHCVGGIWGALATGLFASKSVNPVPMDCFWQSPVIYDSTEGSGSSRGLLVYSNIYYL